MTAPRYPLTAIPIDTPKPKSIAISAYVDEALRGILVDYAEKLSVKVDPMGGAEWDVASNADRSWYASENVATATAMREYLARLLYGDEGLVENLQADEKGDNPWRQMPIPSEKMRAAWEKWDSLFTEPREKRRMLNTHIFRRYSGGERRGGWTWGNLQNFSGWGEPDEFLPFDAKMFNTSPNIFWRPNGKTWAQVEEKVKNFTDGGDRTDVQTELSVPGREEAVEELKREEEGSRRGLLEQVAELSNAAKEITRLMEANDEDKQPISFPNEVSPPLAIATETRNDFANDPELTTKQAPSSDRPTRIILRSYAADDKPRIERLLGLARQLQIPVQLAGSWSCTAFPKGEEAHPALDVVFPEVLVHPRDLLICEGDEKRLFVPSLTEAENQLLWAAREEDQRFITSLIELLGLHAEASREDIAAAVEGGDSEIGIIVSGQLADCHRQRTRYEECDAQVRDILGAVDGEETDEAARRFVEEQKKVHSWRDSVFALRTETAENQRKLLAILNAGTVDPSWQRCLDCAEARMANARKFEEDVNAALGIHPAQSPHSALQRAKWLKEQDKYQTEKLAEALGYKSDDYCELLQQVQRVIREHQTERIELSAKSAVLRAQLNAIHVRMLDILGPDADVAWASIFSTLERLRATLSATEKDRDALKERLETAITAERQTIAQRIDLALTGNAVVTNLNEMLRVVGNHRRDIGLLQNLVGQIADALDAPNEEKAFTNDDGALNTALVDRIVGYYKRLYTAAGYSEPPQGGWEELLTHIRKYTGFISP